MPHSHDHIVKSYDDELTRLDGEIIRMGQIAVAQLDAAIDVLQRRDTQAAMRVVANDEAIDTLEHEVSHDVLRLLALRQPMARDLREVYAALRISSDIERIGDYAANVAKRSMVLNQTAPVSAARGLPALAKLANALVTEALEAYRERDADRALAVRGRDVEIDAEYTGLFRELLTYMAEDPRQITACTHLLFIAKNIERIGDHATNIAENTWFLVHGELPEGDREKGDLTSQVTAGQ
ncbi:phosphate signaling complex protein PhoU [Arenimonas aestuarii]